MVEDLKDSGGKVSGTGQEKSYILLGSRNTGFG
jgi:hypothetical protein